MKLKIIPSPKISLLTCKSRIWYPWISLFYLFSQQRTDAKRIPRELWPTKL